MEGLGIGIGGMRRFISFWWRCLRTAFRGNAAFANDWQWMFGIPVCSGIANSIASQRGMTELSTGYPIADGFLGALAAFVVTWSVAFLVRLVNAPVGLYHEQKDRVDKLEGLNQLTSGVSRAPSFDIGFEVSIDRGKIDRFHEYNIGSFHSFDTQEVWRVWVENLEPGPISDCRVVIEDFGPNSPVKKGVMLLPDNRGSDKESSAKFDLASSEKRYFRFLQLASSLVSSDLIVTIKSDQERTGLAGVFDRSTLEFDKRYFATIAIHGKNAGSGRISLTIDLISESEIVVAKSSVSAQRETI
jgi:hypothetical protein